MRKPLLLIAFVLSTICYADNWMSYISDDTRLCRMSIPGSHDAGTGNGFEGISAIIGTITAKTQDLDLAAQWDAGVRAFDLRPALKNGKLKIYHGSVETKLTFNDALKTICDKLAANPSECAIVLMQNEGNTDVNEWGSYVTQSMERVRDYLIDYTPGMTLGSARGKLLIMNRNLYRPIPYGCVLQGWGDKEPNRQGSIESANGRWGTFHVQDFYDVTADGATDKKKQYVEDMLRQSSAATNDHIFFNYTSGYTVAIIATGITTNARNINTHLAQLLEGSNDENLCTGIVFMDYAGTGTTPSSANGSRLLKAIINANPKIPTSITQQPSLNTCHPTTNTYNIGGQATIPGRGIEIRNGKKYITRH